MSGKDYKLIGAHPEDLADGRILAPGDLVKLSREDLEDPHNQRLVEEGVLLDVEANLKEKSADKSPSKAEKEGD